MSVKDYHLIVCDHCCEYTWETDRRPVYSMPDFDGTKYYKSVRDVDKANYEFLTTTFVCTTCYRKLLPGEAVTEMFNEAEDA